VENINVRFLVKNLVAVVDAGIVAHKVATFDAAEIL
jgi:hypothetical protein